MPKAKKKVATKRPKNVPEIIKCAYQVLADPITLVPNPRNPNKHDDRQIEILSRIIAATGFRQAIVISEESGFIVKGHGRLLAALKLQLEVVPVDVQSYATPAEEMADMIADNRIAELAEIDDNTLAELVRELNETDDFDVTLTGFDETEIDKLLAEVEELGDDAPIDETYEVIVECADEAEQQKAYALLQEKGHKCRLATL